MGLKLKVKYFDKEIEKIKKINNQGGKAYRKKQKL